jgi:hypothetical protein
MGTVAATAQDAEERKRELLKKHDAHTLSFPERKELNRLLGEHYGYYVRIYGFLCYYCKRDLVVTTSFRSVCPNSGGCGRETK